MQEFEEKLPLGLASDNLEATLMSLMMGQVRILLVSGGFRRPGYECPDSGVLMAERKENVCPEGRNPVPITDVVDDAVEEALAQGVEVRVIYDEEAKKIHGIGAIFKFKI